MDYALQTQFPRLSNIYQTIKIIKRPKRLHKGHGDIANEKNGRYAFNVRLIFWEQRGIKKNVQEDISEASYSIGSFAFAQRYIRAG